MAEEDGAMAEESDTASEVELDAELLQVSNLLSAMNQKVANIVSQGPCSTGSGF